MKNPSTCTAYASGKGSSPPPLYNRFSWNYTEQLLSTDISHIISMLSNARTSGLGGELDWSWECQQKLWQLVITGCKNSYKELHVSRRSVSYTMTKLSSLNYLPNHWFALADVLSKGWYNFECPIPTEVWSLHKEFWSYFSLSTWAKHLSCQLGPGPLVFS